MARKCDSPHIFLVKWCFHEYADMCVTQKFQHRVPHVVLVINIGFRRRECGRGVGGVHCQLVPSAEKKKCGGHICANRVKENKPSCSNAPDPNKGTAHIGVSMCVSDLASAVVVPSSLEVVSFPRNLTG